MANETTFTKVTDIFTHVTHYYRHDTHPYGGKPGEVRTEELTREEWGNRAGNGRTLAEPGDVISGL